MNQAALLLWSVCCEFTLNLSAGRQVNFSALLYVVELLNTVEQPFSKLTVLMRVAVFVPLERFMGRAMVERLPAFHRNVLCFAPIKYKTFGWNAVP